MLTLANAKPFICRELLSKKLARFTDERTRAYTGLNVEPLLFNFTVSEDFRIKNVTDQH